MPKSVNSIAISTTGLSAKIPFLWLISFLRVLIGFLMLHGGNPYIHILQIYVFSAEYQQKRIQIPF